MPFTDAVGIHAPFDWCSASGHVTARDVVLPERRHRRRVLAADVDRERAAGVEVAARRRCERARDLAAHGTCREPATGVGLGDRLEQRPRVRMLRPREHLVRRAGLDDLPEVHDGDPVGDVLDDRQVVGDEDQRHAELALEVADEVQDLGLDEHVERRDRLVGDDQVGPERQGRRDRDPLALPARELVRAGSRRGAATAPRSRAARSPGGRGRPACRRRTRRAARAPCGPPASAGRASCRGSGRSAGRGGGSSFAPARPCRPRRRRTARSPPSGASSPSRHLPSVVFPEPDSPTTVSTSPARHVEVDVVDRAQRLRAAEQAAADPELAGDAAGLEEGGSGGAHAARSASTCQHAVACAGRPARECRHPLAGVHAHGTARREPAAGRRVGEIGHSAAGDRQRPTAGGSCRKRREQRLGVGMLAARRRSARPARPRRAARRRAPRPGRTAARPLRGRARSGSPWCGGDRAGRGSAPGSGPGSSRRAPSSARPRRAAPDRWRARWRSRRAAACRRSGGAAGRRSAPPRPGSRPRSEAASRAFGPRGR